VCEVAELLAELVNQNEVEIQFVPSHTEEKIAQSEEIDKLAKAAAEMGSEEVDHDPLVTSYKLMLKKREKLKLEKYLKTNVKPSQFKDYPDRTLLIKEKMRMSSEDGKEDTFIPVNHSHSLVNKVRSGDTRARAHLKNFGIEADDNCRHCNRHNETIENQLIRCRKFEK
jgi:hypothetical protein